MKTFLTTILAICLFVLTCSAQWTTGSSPTSLAAGYSAVSIGTTTQLGTLTVQSGSATQPSLYVGNAASASTGLLVHSGSSSSSSTIFQAEDNSGNIKFLVNGAGRVAVGAITPGTSLDVASATYNMGVRSLNSGAFSAGSGGGLLGASPNTPTASDQRLGMVGFGAVNTGTTYKYASVISGFSSEDWTSLKSGSYLTFNTTPNGTLGLVERVRIDNAGDVGIGTNAPNAQLDVKATTEQLRLTASSAAYASFITSSSGNLSIMPSGGNVGIGTPSPDQALTVNGQVHSTSVVVTSTVPPPDYVFNTDYTLRPLADVKTYVDKNHHLPEVPSAAEFEKKGQNLGEMNMLLLKKVEELTLYMIEQNKKTAELINTVKAQQQEIEDLKKGKK